jgi:hypothetical protein
MALIVNGAPKSGTHAFAAFLNRVGARRCPGTLLGCTKDQDLHVSGAPWATMDLLRLVPDSCYLIGHVAACHAQALEGLPVVTMMRDPRNMLISYRRHRKRVDGVEVSTAEALEDYWGAPFAEVYRGFLAWRGLAAIVRYEDVPAAVAGDGSGIYCRHDAGHNTRTGQPSDWVEEWRAEDHRAWRAAGGPELLEAAGYG